MAIIGEIKNKVEWKILNFSSLSDENSICYSSYNFSFCNETWYLDIFPNGNNETYTGHISLYLIRKSPGPPIKIKYQLRLKTLSGQEESDDYCEYTFTEAEESYGYHDLISRTELFEKKADLLPADVMTVFCSLQFPNTVEAPGVNEVGKCFCCQESLGVKVVSLHEDCAEREIKCPDCEDIILLQNWLQGHDCQMKKTEDDGCLSEDLKKVLLDGCNHDLILKVGDDEFKAHQDILSARSEVFKRMLKYDMTEKNSGIIDISDCDPDAMKVFLSYIYSGKVENLDKSNAIGLYYIADKYHMKILKEKSSDFIKKSVSSINICEVIQLALNHSDSSLLDFATEFFINNVLEILRTVEWQHFMKNNFTVANELMIKSHEKKK